MQPRLKQHPVVLLRQLRHTGRLQQLCRQILTVKARALIVLRLLFRQRQRGFQPLLPVALPDLLR